VSLAISYRNFYFGAESNIYTKGEAKYAHKLSRKWLLVLRNSKVLYNTYTKTLSFRDTHRRQIRQPTSQQCYLSRRYIARCYACSRRTGHTTGSLVIEWSWNTHMTKTATFSPGQYENQASSSASNASSLETTFTLVRISLGEAEKMIQKKHCNFPLPNLCLPMSTVKTVVQAHIRFSDRRTKTRISSMQVSSFVSNDLGFRVSVFKTLEFDA
jgi:hypothetical protein